MAKLVPTISSQHVSPAAFRHRHIFGLVAGLSALFVVLTALAMFFYPGGTVPVAATSGYHFFINFFSDLGQTRTQSGATNYPSMLLFTTSMAMAGIGLGTFFVMFAKVFTSKAATPWALRLNRAATLVGVVAAVCFIGVGATPYNLLFLEHQAFVQWAFRLLLLAILLESAALRLTPGIPRSWLGVNVAFVAILFAYLLLMMFGPSTRTLIGDEIHAVGQKIIVYTAITTIFAQALLVRAHLARPALAEATPERQHA
jgi:hypothetical protein